MLRVLHVIPAVAPRYGGPSRVVFSMCRALRREAVDTLIVSTDADGKGRLLPGLGETCSLNGVPTRLFARQWSEAFKYSRPLAQWVQRGVRDFDVAHIHAVFSHVCLAAARACRRSGVPYVVRPLGSLDPWSLSQKSLRKRMLWHAGVARMLHAAAAIHYTTPEERRLAEGALGLTRGVVIPLGVDEELLEGSTFGWRDPALGSGPYVLYLSRLHPKKGVEGLIRAFTGLAGRDLDRWRLVVAGAGDPAYVAGLQRLARELDPAGRVLFVGWLEGAERLAALRHASLFALPSQQENFALAVAEALAVGVPVVVSDRVNLGEDIRDAGAGWVAAPAPEGLRATLAEALRDERGRAERGAAGRELVRRRFTWAAVTAQLAELYRSVARGSREDVA